MQSGAKHMRSPVACHRNRKPHVDDAPDSPLSVSSTTKGFLFKLEPSFQLSSSAMEGATKWDPDPASFKVLDEVNKMHNSRKKLLDQQANAASVISALES
ncbi:hypothetical protein MLD38_034227 [Melastoma candidum]|uniref:Uncharacterized protein n=1 Tax=Melastoma candidum TaxID=119954 RepID=A0ACB9M992_9MYRT|nr:hypothetical protein MLD38_034227 [Melastoma candidum]